MTDRFTIKQHDLMPHLRVRLLDEMTQPVDLLNATRVNFLMKSRRAGLKVNAPAYIHDQTDPSTLGVVSYRWAAGDTDLSGEFSAEFEVVWPADKRQTFPAGAYLIVVITKDLGNTPLNGPPSNG